MTFLKSLFQAPEKHLKSLLQRGLCFVNGEKERFGSRMLAKGDKVLFYFLPLSQVEKKFDKKRILFENEQLIAYNKPPFVSSLELSLQVPHLKLLHRLDKETSGILLFAKKDPKSFLDLFKKRLVVKGYLALVDGVLSADKGVIKKNIAPLKRFAGQIIMGISRDGLYAETHYIVKKRYKDKTLVLCKPITGRTHQIRVHMKALGHPLLGDYQYASHFQCRQPVPRIMLHAAYVRILDHIIKAPLPEDFKNESRNR